MPFDLTNVETADQSQGFQPIPEGIYPIRVTDGLEKERDGKPPQHEFELTVQYGKYEGRKFKAWFSLSEGHAPFLKLFYEQLGASESELQKASPDKFIGRAVRAGVEVKEYNGKKNNGLRLGEYFAWDGKESTAWGEGTDAAPSDAEVKEKGESPFAKASKPSAKASAKDAASEQSKDLDDDEPPF